MDNATKHASLRALGAATIATLAVGAVTTEAHAFKLKETRTSAHIHWDAGSVVYSINAASSSDLSFEQARDAVQRSFGAWSDQPGSALKMVYGGETASANYGYERGGQNENLVMWAEDDWAFGSEVLAITLTTFSVNNGKLLDADIVINGVDFKWATDGSADRHDLANTLTHEVGHFIGLDHSDHEDATMFPSAPSGELQKRDLSHDDMAGLLSLYGTGELPITGGDPGQPGAAFDPFDGEDSESGYRINDASVHLACTAAAPGGRDGGLGGMLMFGFVLGGALVWRRRRAVASVAVAMLAVGAVMAAPTVADASTLKAMTLEDLSLRSDRVLMGDVVMQEAAFDGGIIWTRSTVRVSNCPVSDRCVEGEEVVVLTPGGEVGGIAQEIAGIEAPRVGEPVMFFLRQRRGLGISYMPVGMSQGVLDVDAMGDSLWASRDLSHVELMRKDRTVVGGEAFSGAVELDALFDEVAQLRLAR